MDAKITLSFDEQVIKEAKEFASKNNISLSRLTEMIFRQMTTKNYQNLDDLPISDWVSMVAEEKAEYTRTPSRKQMKSDFFDSKK
ncbi:DUF6364 family protein [Pseudopedobacter beijingensis]|uniref:DUF6364 family protein n=1 Tax=Pseudopedobacter beijingensis TaxID=1207056 RepID=A0ABW4IH82_9SPHI